jgi:hypothetical protein
MVHLRNHSLLQKVRTHCRVPLYLADLRGVLASHPRNQMYLVEVGTPSLGPKKGSLTGKNPLAVVALLLGFSFSPYGSIQIIILSKRTQHSIYILPSSSPAMPYIHANLLTLTDADLEDIGT